MPIVNTDGLTLFGAGSEWFWSMLQFVIVAITLVGIYVQLRLARSANAFAQAKDLREEWQGERLLRLRLRAARALRADGASANLRAEATWIGNFWESVGGLVRARHIDLALVRDYLGSPCQMWWSALEPEIRRVQRDEQAGVWEDYEWVVGELRQLDHEHGVPPDEYNRERAITLVIGSLPAIEAALADLEAMRSITPTIPPTTPVVAAPHADALGDRAN